MPGPKQLAAVVLALLALQSVPYASAEELSLTVNVHGATPGKGQAICSLFASAETYLRQPLRNRTKPIDANGRAVFRFDRLPAGTYAVSVIYDEDLDGELDTGLLGIPTELIGMYGAKGVFGPPSFKDASFRLTATRTVDIVLGKAKD